MSKVSLYRKYRPNNFENLVGQDHVKEILINSIKGKSLAHAYIFAGPRGTGKTSSARLIAKALNCQNIGEGYEPCDQCEICKDINIGRLIDLVEIDAASNRGIDEIRDLKEKINYSPTRSQYKIYIIDEVHMLTKEAFNALLKTLEEPPSHSHFILATTEIHKIPSTIISRCQRFDFRRISDEVLVKRLSQVADLEGIKIENDLIQKIAQYANGGLRDALGLLDQLAVNGEINEDRVKDLLGVLGAGFLDNFIDQLFEGNAESCLKIIEEIHLTGADFDRFIYDLIIQFRRKLLLSTKDLSENNTKSYISLIEIFQEAKESPNNAIPQLPLEIATAKALSYLGKMNSNLNHVPPSANSTKIEASKTEVIEKSSKPQNAEKSKDESTNKPLEKGLEKTINKKTTSVKEKKSEQLNTKSTSNNLSANWSQILSSLKSPSLRMSLKHAKIETITETKVTLVFATNFHQNIVEKDENLVQLEAAIKEIVDTEIKVETLIKAGAHKAIKKPTNEAKVLPEVQKEQEKKVSVDEAIDIFGGGEVLS